MDTETPVVWPSWCYGGETSGSNESLDNPKSTRRKHLIASSNNTILSSAGSDYSQLHNNNNNVKNERTSPSTSDTFSRSRSVTPSPLTTSENLSDSNNPLINRQYSDIMRSLAAKYNNTNPNDYFSTPRNGFATSLDSRFNKSLFPPGLLTALPTTSNTTTKEPEIMPAKKMDFNSVLNPITAGAMLPPFDMSATQTILAMVKAAKEAELQGLLKNVKRPDTTSPLDLSSAPPIKRMRTKMSPKSNPSPSPSFSKCSEGDSPAKGHEDISTWSVEEVATFVESIDICAEYAQNFREQRIDGSGLPLLTEEHLIQTIGMKLGPALKLRSVLKKKLGMWNSTCLHCTSYHNGIRGTNSPSMSAEGNISDSGGVS